MAYQQTKVELFDGLSATIVTGGDNQYVSHKSLADMFQWPKSTRKKRFKQLADEFPGMVRYFFSTTVGADQVEECSPSDREFKQRNDMGFILRCLNVKGLQWCLITELNRVKKKVPRKHRADANKLLDVPEDADMKDLLMRAKGIRELIDISKKEKHDDGFVYLLHNTAGDVAKVGKAADCRKRWKSYQCPLNWKPQFAVWVSDQAVAERKLIKYMNEHYTLGCGTEFFWCDNVKPVMHFMTITFGKNRLSEI